MVGTRMRYFFCDEKSSSLSDTMRLGAFAEYKKVQKSPKESDEPTIIFPNNAPFSKLFTEKISPDKHSEDSESLSNNANNDSKTTGETEAATEVEAEAMQAMEKENNGNQQGSSLSLESRLEALTMVSTNDDFIMHTPFASSNGKSELGKFYKEWQSAPPLQTFIDLPPLETMDLKKQLETFESDLDEYDTIVQSLCQSPNNN